MTIYPVIMCGGSGTRLWPASRPSRPKQFIPLIGDRSTFQTTVLRLGQIEGATRPLIITGDGHADWVRRELAALGVAADVLLEPEPRDSAAAVAAAAAWVAARDMDGALAIVAADHHVPDAAAFARAIETAAEVAADGWIVTLGVKPDRPSNAYGYIAPAETVSGAVLKVARFVEKPDTEKARGFVEAGYLWNSGNFIASARTLTEAFAEYAPAVGEAARLGVERAGITPVGWRLDQAFLGAPRISFDYAVMEKATRRAVLPVSFAWSDLGAWDSIWAASDHDAEGNVGADRAVLVNTTNSFVRLPGNETRKVVLLGLTGVAVVADETHLLIANLSASEGVKAVAERAKTPEATPADRLVLHADRYDRWLRTAALPIWWALGADHRAGGYYDLLDQDGRPIEGPRRARVQARQSFVYTTAERMGLPGDWRPAALHGLAYMRERFAKPNGLYRTTVDASDRALDDDAFLYDQAFFLMASATLAGLVDDPAPLRAECEALLEAIERTLRHGAGGFREAGAHPFQANCHMHLLEAALAWIEAGGDARWTTLAAEIVDLAMTRFIDAEHGFLREFFDQAWRPAAGADGRRVEPGHQFEWAWLLARWARLTGSADAARAAGRLFDAGVLGVDRQRSVAIDAMDEFDGVAEAGARLWPQTEYIKAALYLAEDERLAGRSDEPFLAHAARGADGLWVYLGVPVAGLWRDKLRDDATFVEEPAPASSFYHILGAIVALKAYAEA